MPQFGFSADVRRKSPHDYYIFVFYAHESIWIFADIRRLSKHQNKDYQLWSICGRTQKISVQLLRFCVYSQKIR